MLALSSTTQVVDALQRCRSAEAQAYTLRGEVLHALEDAARRGARVRVELEADPVTDTKGGLARENRRLIAEMRACGIDARLESHVHAKEIDVDGTLFLDEKNWRDGDLIVRDDDADRAQIAMRKSDALAKEASMLKTASNADSVIVESETFGETAVSGALRTLAREGCAPRLLVDDRTLRGNSRELRELKSLERDGVRVRVCRDSAKLAIAEERAWLGSANATSAWGPYDMTDWGTCTDLPAIAGAVRQRLENSWSSARPLCDVLQ